jgi:hypothetical protein
MRHFGIRVSTVAAGEFWNDVRLPPFDFDTGSLEELFVGVSGVPNFTPPLLTMGSPSTYDTQMRFHWVASTADSFFHGMCGDFIVIIVNLPVK